jgi:glutaryl-CoA dehydrogenase
MPAIERAWLRGVKLHGYGLIMQELERADSGLRSLASVQGSLVIYAIHSFGTPEQHERWLPGLVSGHACRLFRANGTWTRL